MSTSLQENLPIGLNRTLGIRNIRLRDAAPISVRSMTKLAVTVYAPKDFSTGNVYASHVRLAVYGNGQWFFTAQLNDTSVLFGDNYAIGFSFEDSGVAGLKTGELGADETSTPQHVKFDIKGRSDLLQRNYPECIAHRVKFRLARSTDAAGALADIGDDLKWLGRNIWLGVSSSEGCDDSDECGPENGGWDGGSSGGGGIDE
jgi:hypothetical protein